MGVTWVFNYTGPLNESQIGVRLTEAGAERKGLFRVDAVLYDPAPDVDTILKRFHIAHHSNFPSSSFVVTGVDRDPWTPQAVADTQIDSLLAKNSAYSRQPAATIESQGSQYEIDDFVIRVGSVSVASNFKGITIETDYTGSSVPAQCDGLMREFCEGLLGSVKIAYPPPPFPQRFQMDKFKAGQTASASDTIAQYMEIFAELRK